jgi:hypothetical protein
MHTRHCAKLAHRIDRLLEREIGLGLDGERMLGDALYARDVLLVCDALAGPDGPLLARAFRRAAAAAEEGSAPAVAPRPEPGTRSRWLALLGLGLGAQEAALASRNSSAPSAT